MEFKKTAYMNDYIFLIYIQLYVTPALEARLSLFAVDFCPCLKTSAVLDTLREEGIIPSMIPPRFTSLVQPFHGWIKKQSGDIIWSIIDQVIRDYESKSDFERWTVGGR